MTRIQIYDTTLRDGSQGEGVNFSLQDKLLITQRLDELGFDFIEGGYPLSNPKDAEYFQRARDLDLKHATVTAFGMTRRRGAAPEEDTGMVALRDSQAKICVIVGKTWDLHVFEVLRVDEAENLAMIRDSVGYLHGEGRRVFYDAEHFFDGYRANPEFALKTIKMAEEAGAEIVVLCDTNGGRLPEEVADAVRAARQALTIPVGIHCHNDCDLAVANSLAAVDAGAIQVQGTINGIGERCGNVDLCSVVANLALKKSGYEVLAEGGLKHLAELSRYVYELANMNYRNGQPFVGTSAFAHKGGMHVHAVNRLAKSYEHIEPETVGNVRRVLISELSGKSNIVAKTTKYAIQNDSAMMQKILDRVQDLENEGFQFEAAEASFDLLVRKIVGQYQPKFEKVHYRVNVESDGGEKGGAKGVRTHLPESPEGRSAQMRPDPFVAPATEATIKLRVAGKLEHVVAEGDGPGQWKRGQSAQMRPDPFVAPFVAPATEATIKLRVAGRLEHVVAEGDGPVNALDTALRKALIPAYPNLAEMQLVDYKVRVINSTAGTAARVRVVIESRDDHEVWTTVGVSENIIEASWLALVDSVEYKLFKDEQPAS